MSEVQDDTKSTQESPKILPEGIYKGRIVNYGFAKTAAGDPLPAIAFAVQHAGREYVVFWKGSFNGKAKEFTIKALITCGLREASKIATLADGVQSGLLDQSKDYQVDVGNEMSQGDDPKPYARVNWINEAGGTVRDAITKGEATGLLAGLNLGGAFQEQLKKLGITVEKKAAPVATPATPSSGSNPIPF